MPGRRLFREVDDPARQALVLNALAIVCGEIGRLDESARHLEQALILATHRNDTRTRAAILCNLGNLHGRLGQLDASRKYMRQALQLSQRMNNGQMTARFLGNLAVTYLELGQYKRAESCAARSLAHARIVAGAPTKP